MDARIRYVAPYIIIRVLGHYNLDSKPSIFYKDRETFEYLSNCILIVIV